MSAPPAAWLSTLPHTCMGVVQARDPQGKPWSFAALRGRMVEVSGSASLSAAVQIAGQAQQEGALVAWVSVGERGFFPPDVARCGVDLEALPVVLADRGACAVRQADKLVRSGVVGLVVVDLTGDSAVPDPLLVRVAGLAAYQSCAVLCLTARSRLQPSLHPRVSLRVEALWHVTEEFCFKLRIQALKDKNTARLWSDVEVWDGPPGCA